MNNTKTYYTLINKRMTLEEELDTMSELIRNIQDDAKKLKKGSIERQDLMRRANEIKNSETYKNLKLRIEMLNFCINTVFYS